MKLARCTDCIEKAKLRNRDMDTAIIQAKTQAIEDKKPKAVCWSMAQGLFIEDAKTACTTGLTIRYICTGLP